MSGKTSTLGKLIENLVYFRTEEEEELSILYIDSEGTFNVKFVNRFDSLTDEDFFLCKEHIIEKVWNQIETLLEKNAIDIVVIDSIGALQTMQEDDKAIQENTVGALPKKINTMIKKFYEATEESGLTVIVVNQEYQNINTMGYGPQKTLKGGGALRYGKSISLEVKN